MSSREWEDYLVDRVRLALPYGIAMNRPGLASRKGSPVWLPKDLSEPCPQRQDQALQPNFSSEAWMSARMQLAARQGFVTISISKPELLLLEKYASHQPLEFHSQALRPFTYVRLSEAERWRKVVFEQFDHSILGWVHSGRCLGDLGAYSEMFTLTVLSQQLAEGTNFWGRFLGMSKLMEDVHIKHYRHLSTIKGDKPLSERY